MHPESTLFGHEFASYGLMAALGLLFATLLSLWLTHKFKLKAYITLSLIIGASSAGFLGGFLAYLLITYPLDRLPGILHDGSFSPGFVYYGGLICGILTALLISRRAGWSFEAYSSALIPGLALAHGIGRIGCFLAGCCYGVNSNSLLSIQFPFLDERVLPVQLYEAVIEFVLCALLIFNSLKRKTGLTELYILLYAPLRFILEFWRGDEIRGRFLLFSTSQWISLFLILVVGAIRVKKLRRS